MANHLRTELVLNVLNMTLARRRPHRVVHHSDKGSQYTSLAFGNRYREMGVVTSTGTVGDCFDNAMAESFFATWECKLIDRRCFCTQVEARMAIFQFLEVWYNAKGRHSALGYLSPADFERIIALRSTPATVGDPLPPVSDSGAMSSISPNGYSRGRGTHRDILQESSAGQPQASSESIYHPPNHESPYLSTETG